MKNSIQIIFFVSCFFTLFSASAQAPQKMSYQAVIRNASNTLVANTNVSMKISILQGSATGTVTYVETQNTTTNVNGLATIQIGAGTAVTGVFADISWSNGLFFIKTETDPTGGTSYTITGTSQLMSVPYALYAEKSGNTWGTAGNAGTNTASNFIGTTDDNDIIFKRNGELSGRIGDNNVSIGKNAAASNTTGNGNIAIGQNALTFNTIGNDNTASGYRSLMANTIGGGNVAMGTETLNSNTQGSYNTAHGYLASFANSIGNYNTAVGYAALRANITGSNNTSIESGALSTLTNGSNNIGIGASSNVPNATGDNQVRVGNTFVTYAGIQVPWSITSDSRWKSDIKKSSLGLDFISKLNPVSYTRKNDDSKKTEYGFIAQELDATLHQFDAKNNGIITKDDAGMYSVRYNDLLAPMVKAIQEQQIMIEQLKKEIELLKK